MKRFMHLGHLLEISVSNLLCKELDVDSLVVSCLQPPGQLSCEHRQERHRQSSDPALVKIPGSDMACYAHLPGPGEAEAPAPWSRQRMFAG